MKKITLLFLLVGCLATAQGKKDLQRRSGDLEMLQKIRTKNNLDSDLQAFVAYKMYAIEPVVKLTEEQKDNSVKMFAQQFPLLQDAHKRFTETKSAASKVELIKIIVFNEEAFRKTLTPDQLLTYLRYGDKISVTAAFDDNYMSDDVLKSYKKELL